jgi:mono/diheme cytochrome c family protein
MKSRGLVLLTAVAAWNAVTAIATHAQSKTFEGSVAAGRTLALQACASCHVVAADQPYKPIYRGAVRPADFKDIANKPSASAASLRAYLASLPVIPKNSQMANPDLNEQELRDVSAFIMTLRDQSPKSPPSPQSSR